MTQSQGYTMEYGIVRQLQYFMSYFLQLFSGEEHAGFLLEVHEAEIRTASLCTATPDSQHLI